MKTCSLCKISKHKNEFNKNAASPDGYQARCRECDLANNKKWRDNNKDRLRQYRASDHYRKMQNTTKKNKRCNDPSYKLVHTLRTRLTIVLKQNKRGINTKDGIGCSPQELVAHIESQWEPGMSWDNYGNKPGQWSIDHIKPFCLIDKDDVDSIVKNNHYTNLRPMWHIDNITRSYEEFDRS